MIGRENVHLNASLLGLSREQVAERMEEIIERARTGGAEILALRKNSSAYDAPGASVALMVDAIVKKTESQNYPVRTLVREVLLSDGFVSMK